MPNESWINCDSLLTFSMAACRDLVILSWDIDKPFSVVTGRGKKKFKTTTTIKAIEPPSKTTAFVIVHA